MIRYSDFSGKQFLFLATGFKSQAKIFFFKSKCQEWKVVFFWFLAFKAFREAAVL